MITEEAEMGTIRLSITFRHGLGPYHEKLIAKNPSLKGVFEVLRTANESKEVNFTVDKEDGSDSSSDSDSSDSDDEKDDHHVHLLAVLRSRRLPASRFAVPVARTHRSNVSAD